MRPRRAGSGGHLKASPLISEPALGRLGVLMKDEQSVVTELKSVRSLLPLVAVNLSAEWSGSFLAIDSS